MKVERFEAELWQTVSLLLVDGAEAVAIDPGISREEVARIAWRAGELDARVTAVLATHADWDHVCGIAAFPNAEATMGRCTAELVAGSAAAVGAVELAAEYGIEVAGPARVDRRLEPGVAHQVGPFAVETLSLPGHTPDGMAYRFRALNLLVVGDYLSTVEFPFASSTADYRSTLATLVDILRRDPPARVVPAHGPEHTPTTALAVAEADLGYLWRLHDVVSAALARGAGPEKAHAAGLAVDLPRPAPADLAAERAANVDVQLAELLPSPN